MSAPDLLRDPVPRLVRLIAAPASVGFFFHTMFNVVLDPWLVFGGFGMPPLGIRGVAIATVGIQALVCLYMLRRAVATGLIGRATLGRMRPQWTHQLQILGQVFPASLNMLTVGAGIFVITWFVSRFGQAALAAYGIATRIEQLVLLPGIGLNRAALALAGQNFGAGRLDRVRASLQACLGLGAWLMIGGGVLLLLLAEPITALFTRDPVVSASSVQYLRITAFALWSYVVLYVTVSTLQGLKQPRFAVWIGLTRQIALPLLLFPLLTDNLGMGLVGIWWGVFLVNWVAALFSIAYTYRAIRKAEPAG